MKASIVLLVLAFAACGRVADDSKTVIVPAGPEVVDAVAADLLDRLEEACDEDGPRFTTRLPALKDAAARDAGYDGWGEFKECLRAADPKREVALTRQITRKMQELLNRPEPSEEDETE
jgi:hypothetical protein